MTSILLSDKKFLIVSSEISGEEELCVNLSFLISQLPPIDIPDKERQEWYQQKAQSVQY